MVTDYLFIGEKRFEGKSVCGYVNAKNRMGGYVGRSPYLYDTTQGASALMQPPTTNDLELLKLSISDQSSWKEKWLAIQTSCDFIDRWQRTCPALMSLNQQDTSVRLCRAWLKKDSTTDSVLQEISN